MIRKVYDMRPRIRVPLTRLHVGIEIATVGILVIMLFCVWQVWPSLPERVPQKFDLSGQPTRWGERSGLWLLPGLSLGIYTLLSVLQRMPHVYNYPTDLSPEEAPRLYEIGVSLVMWMKLQVVVLFALLSWRQVEVALGRTSGLEAWIVPALVTLNLGTVAYHLLRMREARQRS